MPLESYQLATNAKVDVGGSTGSVVSVSARQVQVQREDGKIETYATDSVLAEGNIYEEQPENDTVSPGPAQSPTQDPGQRA